MIEQPKPFVWVRTGPASWVSVHPETGRDPHTGEIPVEWKEPEPKGPDDRKFYVSKSGKARFKKKEINKAVIKPDEWVKAAIEPSTVEAPWENEPNHPKWAKRDFYSAYEWARIQFVKNAASLALIARETGFSLMQVRTYAYYNTTTRRSWIVDRASYQNAVLRQMTKDTKERCSALMDSMMDVVEKRIEVLRDDVKARKQLKVFEIKALVSAIKEVHEISKLDDDKAENIIENVKISRDEILRRLKEADPLVCYESTTTTTAAVIPAEVKRIEPPR